MSCEIYTNNGGVLVPLQASTVPPGWCPTNWQEILEGFAAALQAVLPGNYSTFIFGDATPAPEDRDKLWIKLDAAHNCRPVGFYMWSNGAWVQVGAQVFYGADTSVTPNNFTVSTLYPSCNFLDASGGQLFIIRANTYNTGPATLTLPIPGAAAIPIDKYGFTALNGGEILAGMYLLIAYDDSITHFRLLNPIPLISSTGTAQVIFNGSFELDSNGDGIPDSWDFNGDLNAVGGVACTGTLVSPGTGHGDKAFRMIPPGGGGNVPVGQLRTHDFWPCAPGQIKRVGWWMKVAHTGVDANPSPVTVYLEYYAVEGGPVLGSFSTLYYADYADDTGNALPVNWAHFISTFRVPAGAYFYKLVVQVGDNATPAKQSRAVYLDGFEIGDQLAGLTQRNYQQSTFWQCPAGVYNAIITAVGGGGGGGYSTDPNPAVEGGAGGGAGGAGVSQIRLIPTRFYQINIGEGGAGGIAASVTDAIDGGDSEVIDPTVPFTWVSAFGGGFGDHKTPAHTPGSGGNAGTFANALYGMNGDAGTRGNAVTGQGGAGGATLLAGSSSYALASTNGNNGIAPGGGGGGGGRGGVITNGGTGGGGSVIIEFFFP